MLRSQHVSVALPHLWKNSKNYRIGCLLFHKSSKHKNTGLHYRLFLLFSHIQDIFSPRANVSHQPIKHTCLQLEKKKTSFSFYPSAKKHQDRVHYMSLCLKEELQRITSTLGQYIPDLNHLFQKPAACVQESHQISTALTLWALTVDWRSVAKTLSGQEKAVMLSCQSREAAQNGKPCLLPNKTFYT